MRRIFKYSLMAAFLVSLMASVAGAQFQLFGNPLIGKKAAEFTLKDLDGQAWTLSQIRDGKPAILFFWATWCPHCRSQVKILNQEIDAIHKEGIEVILIDLGEDAKQVKSFMERNKFDLNVLVDPDEMTSEDYVIPGIPTLYFIGADGKVRAVEHAIPENYEEILLK